MDRPVIAALAELLGGFVQLSKSRLETMALIVVGMIGARTVNLAQLASEGSTGQVALASTDRRLQRLFQATSDCRRTGRRRSSRTWRAERLERISLDQVHLIERDAKHSQRLACLGLCSI